MQAYAQDDPRPLAPFMKPTVEHNMVGIAFSGGGIRSATFNLGVAQELHRRGVFTHADYLSSVSGGGYLAASISTLMRHKTTPYAGFPGVVSIKDPSKPHITIHNKDTGQIADLKFADTAKLAEEIVEGATVRAGQGLLKRSGPAGKDRFVSLMDSFSWRVRPRALGREMLSKLDENHAWINLSDGGHIENMATIELLRRRCKIILIGDAEADPNMHFAGLATLIRFARIDLGIDININLDTVRLRRRAGRSREHFAIGQIVYPIDEENGLMEPEIGYLVYFKSSTRGDEDEVIKEYKDRNPTFPHETTADQMFDEGQFEAYRALGEHIVKSALPPEIDGRETLTFEELENWVRSAKLPQITSDNPGADLSKSLESKRRKRSLDPGNV